ncbi:MAG: hypothetical protein JNK25_05515 [Phycisphaerae bacterium]|nr:hypothetical protein [Phycisphaerae bacterium]
MATILKKSFTNSAGGQNPLTSASSLRDPQHAPGRHAHLDCVIPMAFAYGELDIAAWVIPLVSAV